MSDIGEQETTHHNVVLISSLWAEWVCVVCGWEGVPTPTPEEWAALKQNFYYDKAPIDSVAELKILRRPA